MSEPIEWTRLGKSGLKISKVIIGCMTYGSRQWSDWVMDDEEEIFKVLKHAYDRGMRTYDTADMYSNGQSEVILGKFLKKYNIKRDKVVIMTKVFHPVDEALALKHGKNDSKFDLDLVNSKGLSRKHVLDGVEGSVRRLGTYIDLLQIHRLDYDTPPEEIMKALNDVVEQGHVRYIGASSMLATEFAELQFVAEKHGWHKFVSMQDYYNLLYREEEREMHHFCNKTGVGIIPWSPNARGVLTRPLSKSSGRAAVDPQMANLGLDSLSENDELIVKRVEELAKKKGVSMAMVASAWVLHKGACPIVGLSSVERVDEAIAATKLKLSLEDMEYLEELYQPKALTSFVRRS